MQNAMKKVMLQRLRKKVISKNATVGVYYWKHGSDYESAEEMIKKNVRVNNEFYVCPVYNEFLSKNKKVKIHNVDKMWVWELLKI